MIQKRNKAKIWHFQTRSGMRDYGIRHSDLNAYSEIGTVFAGEDHAWYPNPSFGRMRGVDPSSSGCERNRYEVNLNWYFSWDRNGRGAS